ncbi:hypothetical protein K010075C41_09840 [Sellimonas intestinalis]
MRNVHVDVISYYLFGNAAPAGNSVYLSNRKELPASGPFSLAMIRYPTDTFTAFTISSLF